MWLVRAYVDLTADQPFGWQAGQPQTQLRAGLALPGGWPGAARPWRRAGRLTVISPLTLLITSAALSCPPCGRGKALLSRAMLGLAHLRSPDRMGLWSLPMVALSLACSARRAIIDHLGR